MFRHSEGKVNPVCPWWKYPFPKCPLLCECKGVAEGPCILNHRFLAYLCQETSGYSRWGKCKETARQGILQCTSFWATAKHFLSFIRKKKKKKLKGILKRENPIQGWIPPAAQGCSSQRYLPLSPYLRGSMYCLQFCVCEMWWYGGILKTKGRIFSLKGNKNVLSQNTKSFPRLSPLQTMHG